MIIVIKSFLSFSECDTVINFYNNNLDKKFVYYNTELVGIIECNDCFINECLQKINKKCNDLTKVYMDNAEIVKWVNGSFMGPHYDVNDELSAIVYLNSNYEGGELIVEDVKIKPETGDLIIFKNGKLLHSVNKTIGERYTLATWFKKQLI